MILKYYLDELRFQAVKITFFRSYRKQQTHYRI
jgi:hypothetical protein